MAYITQADVEPYLDSATVEAMYTDAGVLDSVALAQAFVDASNAVDVALYASGGSSGVTLTGTIPAAVKEAAVGRFLVVAHARKVIPMPAEGPFGALVSLLDAIASGAFRVPGLTYSATASVGGVLFSESDPSFSDSRPQIFDPVAIRRLW